jgi:hypothetical protein
MNYEQRCGKGIGSLQPLVISRVTVSGMTLHSDQVEEKDYG